jgi:hypothetical protein
MYSLSGPFAASRCWIGHELPPRIAQLGDEERSAVELTGDLVDTVGVGVPAPQDLLVVVCDPRGQPDVRVGWDDRSCRAPRRQVDRLELRAARQRARSVEMPTD